MTLHRPLSAALGVALLLAACSGAAPSPSPSPTSVPSVPVAPDPTAVPGASDGAGSGGGGSDPGQGGGTLPGDPGDPGAGDGPATPVQPVAGAVGVHDVAATGLQAAVDGRRVTVELRWWSGVEPCYVLAGVDVVRDGTTFTLTILEGSAAGPDVACIEIAMLKSTIVDLGDLEPGSYTIRALGDVAVEVTVAG